MQLLAALDERAQTGALHVQTEVERDALQVDAVARQQLHVAVVDEADAVQVDDTQVRRVRLDLADVDHLVDLLLLLVTVLEGACNRHARQSGATDSVSVLGKNTFSVYYNR